MNPLALGIVGGVVLVATATGAYFKGHGDGRVTKVEEFAAEERRIRQEEFDKYVARAAQNRAAYRARLERLQAAAAKRPRIIKEIINAPPTECSVARVRPRSVRLINEAIARREDPGAGRSADDAPAGFVTITGRRDLRRS